MRLVLDTCVMVSAFRSPAGASAEILRLTLNGTLEIAATTAIFLEYEDVLQRPIQRLAHGRSIAEVDRLLTFLSSKIVPVEIYFRWRPQLLDANDEMFLDAAVNGRVDGIVTHNSKHFIPAARFGIPVFSPAQLLQKVRL